MKQIILSTVSLAQSWLVEDLLDVLNQEKRVFVLTCIREEFQMIGESVEVLSQKEIARSLLRYGVLKTQITFCRLVEHNVSKIKRALENCDVFIFVGNDAHLAHHRLVDFHLISAVKHFISFINIRKRPFQFFSFINFFAYFLNFFIRFHSLIFSICKEAYYSSAFRL